MIKLNRARTILISLAISLLILGVPAAISRRFRLAAADLFEPITSTAHNLFGGMRARITSYGKGTELQQELAEERRRNAELETRLAEVTEELALYKRTNQEIKDLRRLLERAGHRGEAVPARVIRRRGKWESHELIIDRGTEGGVRPRCPVLVGEAVLGVVAEASGGNARILVLGHPELAVPARIAETRHQGLVEAAGGRLKLNYVVRDQVHPVRQGHTVVSSGLGEVFPRGCLVGRVGPGVAPAEGKPFYDITVELPRATGNPEIVWVLVGSPAGD